MIGPLVALGLCALAPDGAGTALDSAPIDAPIEAHDDDDRGTGVEGHAGTSLELDTNAKRLPSGTLGGDDGHVKPPPPTPPEQPAADGLARVEGSLDAWVKRGALALRTENAVGVKGFFTQSSEDMIVAQSRETLSAALPANFALTLSLLGKGRAQLSGVRTYGLVDATALVDKPVLDWLSLRAGVDGQAFHSLDVPLFSSAGGALLLGAAASSGPERLALLVDAGGRGFPFAPKNLDDPGDPARRTDGIVVATLQATSARRLYLSLGYTLLRNASNARGESFTRHRVGAVVGFRLPAQLTCTAQATLQLTQYDDGVSVGQVYFLGDDEESQNVLDVTLTRPLIGPVSVVGRVSFMGNELAVEGARFSRETASIGIQAAF